MNVEENQSQSRHLRMAMPVEMSDPDIYMKKKKKLFSPQFVFLH